jgi:hypothetical protein
MEKLPNITTAIIAGRRRYKALDIFDQVREHKSWKYWCECQKIDMFLLNCTDEHFNDLLKAQNLDEACNVTAS